MYTLRRHDNSASVAELRDTSTVSQPKLPVQHVSGRLKLKPELLRLSNAHLAPLSFDEWQSTAFGMKK